MLTEQTWHGRKDNYNPEIVSQAKGHLAGKGKEFHTIWTAFGTGLWQVGRTEDKDKSWTPSILYLSQDGWKWKSQFATQVDRGAPLILSLQMDGKLTNWLQGGQILGGFRAWAETELSLMDFQDFWAEVGAGFTSRFLRQAPQLSDLLAQWFDTGGAYFTGEDGGRLRRVEVFRRMAASLQATDGWRGGNKKVKLFVLTLVGTEFARRWSGWDKVRENEKEKKNGTGTRNR